MKPTIKKIRKAVSTPDYLRILILRTVGNFLVLISVFTIVKTFYEPLKGEARYYADKLIQKKYVVADVEPAKPLLTIKKEIAISPQPNKISEVFKLKQVEVITPQDTNFGVVIPKIAANARIIGNVSAADSTVYQQALKQGVAHAAGTALPGEGGHIFLFAHSTDYWWNVGAYNAIFYLLYKLEQGDEVNLFYNGQRYVYEVIGNEVVEASQVEYLTRKTNREFLTLQTCWPPGTTLKRLLVYAVRKTE